MGTGWKFYGFLRGIENPNERFFLLSERTVFSKMGEIINKERNMNNAGDLEMKNHFKKNVNWKKTLL